MKDRHAPGFADEAIRAAPVLMALIIMVTARQHMSAIRLNRMIVTTVHETHNVTTVQNLMENVADLEQRAVQY